MRNYLKLILFPLFTLILLGLFYRNLSLEFLSYFDLWGSSILAGIFASMISAGIGVYLILNRIVFLGLAVTQISGVGVFLSFGFASLFGVHLLHTNYPLIGAILLSIFSMILFSRLKEQSSLSRESIMGVVFVISSSLIVLIGNSISEGQHEIDHLLFGSIVSVSPSAFWIVFFSFIIFLIFQVLNGRKFLMISFDEKFSFTSFPELKKYKIFLFIFIGLGIALSSFVIGNIPTFAFMILPPLLALKLGRGSSQVFIIIMILSLLSLPIGYYISYIFSLPTGASVIVYLGLWVAFQLIIDSSKILSRAS